MISYEPVKKKRFIFVTCLTFVLLFYFQTFRFSFVWDDFDLIVDNPYLRGSLSFQQIFGAGLWDHSQTGFYFPYYRPITFLFSVLQFDLWKTDPLGYHVVNILLHLCCFILLWSIARKFKLSTINCVVVGIFFSIHPVQVSSISYIACQGDLLAQVFILLSLRLWMEGTSARYLALGTVFIALLSKEIAVLSPFILILYDVIFRPTSSKKIMFAPMIPVFIYFVIRHAILHSTTGLHQLNFGNGNGGFRILLFLGRILFPLPSPSEWLIPHFTDLKNRFFDVLFFLLFVITYWKSHVYKVPKFLLLWIIITLLPIGDWVGTGLRFSDQLLYVSMAPVAIMVGMYNWKTKFGAPLIMLLFLIYTILSFDKIQSWKDDLTFWKNELRFQPYDPQANLNFAVALIADGRAQEGCRVLAKTENLLVYTARTSLITVSIFYNDLGNCFLDVNAAQAEFYYRKSLSAQPLFNLPKFSLVKSLILQDKKLEAKEIALSLTNEKPDWYLSWVALSNVQQMLGDSGSSIKSLQHAADLNPSMK